MISEKDSSSNSDSSTIDSFGDEWTRFDQTALASQERSQMFEAYFHIFPWKNLSSTAEGFDMGCGSGRWASLVAPKVGMLACIDPSPAALSVARRNLRNLSNVRFLEAGVANVPLANSSQDFGYSLGVLHHVPNTQAALTECVRLLKPGAPFLLYLYYRFDNRPPWFRVAWQASDFVRRCICHLPPRAKHFTTDAIAAIVYVPLSRFAAAIEHFGLAASKVPLSYYRDKSFYTMRTDSRDRFGTPLEQRFTRLEIEAMMRLAGLTGIEFSECEPYWVACGRRSGE